MKNPSFILTASVGKMRPKAEVPDSSIEVMLHYHHLFHRHQQQPSTGQRQIFRPSDVQQLERLEKDLEQAKQKLLVLRAQGHQEALQAENRVQYSQRVSESRYWTSEERQRFKKALKTFGTDFAAIAKFVGTRSSTQVRTHAQKYYAKLIRDYKRSGKAQSAGQDGRMATTL